MKILMVCLGNICRSPLAEGILKSKLPANFVVESAGTISRHEGECPDQRSIDTAQKYGIDVSQQKSRPIKKSDLDEFDRIYCMDRQNFLNVMSLAENDGTRKKIFLFREAAGETGNNLEVPDPYFGDLEGFDSVYKMLDKGADRIAADLLAQSNLSQ